MTNYPAMSLYAHAHAPWAADRHARTCPLNADARAERRLPTHRCDEGHYFNADDLPALEESPRLATCPLFHKDDPSYDDGPCGAKLRELDCACPTREDLEDV
jgi:hypothetical protein